MAQEELGTISIISDEHKDNSEQRNSEFAAGSKESLRGMLRGARRKAEDDIENGRNKRQKIESTDAGSVPNNEEPNASKEGGLETAGPEHGLDLGKPAQDPGVRYNLPDLNQAQDGNDIDTGCMGGSSEAMKVVRGIHGVLREPPGTAANFPGSVGESYVYCQCCQKPEDTKAIICDGCEKSFHVSCLKLRPKSAAQLAEWTCLACAKSGPSAEWRFGKVQQKMQASQQEVIHRKGGGNSGANPEKQNAGVEETLNIKPKEPEATPVQACIPSGSISVLGASKSLEMQEPIHETPRIVKSSDLTFSASIMSAANSNQSSGTEETKTRPCSKSGMDNAETKTKSDFGDDEMKRISAETLQNLRSFIVDKSGGILDERWTVEVKRRKGEGASLDKIYYSPDKQKFRSRLEVARFLGLATPRPGKGDTRQHKSDCTEVNYLTAQDKDKQAGLSILAENNLSNIFGSSFGATTYKRKRTNASQTPLFFQVPFSVDDLIIESFGSIDARPAYHDERHIWPPGYCCTWNVAGTRFLCVNEIVDGGHAGPIFRITFKLSCSDTETPDNLPNANEKSTSKSVVETHTMIDSSFINHSLESSLVPQEDNKRGRLENDSYSQSYSYEEDIDIPFLLGDLDGGYPYSTMNETLSWDLGPGFPEHLGTASPINTSILEETKIKEAEEVVTPEAAGKEKEAANVKVSKTEEAVKKKIKFDELVVEGKSPKGAWAMLQKNFLAGGTKSINMLKLSKDEHVSILEAMHEDKFGLEIPIVQGIIESLPGAEECARYYFLEERNFENASDTQTRKKQAAEQEFTCVKRLRMECLFIPEDKHIPPPHGQPLLRKVPTVLVGDLIEVLEFLSRFSEVLGLENSVSAADLEEGLIDSWPLESSRMGSGKNKKGAPVLENGNTTRTGKKNASMEKLLSKGYAALTAVHIPLLNLLMHDTQKKILGSSPGECDGDSRKNGKAQLPVNSSLPLNAITWPEVARRYLVAQMAIQRRGQYIETNIEDCNLVLRCIQGDGGSLCGALSGVAGAEADSQLLAGAEKKLQQVGGRGREDGSIIVDDEARSADYTESRHWAEVLEPVAKLPTNVGSRIKNRVLEAIALDPPRWAKEILEWSIQKDVYKSNAAGQTKSAVLSILEQFHGKDIAPKRAKKTKKVFASLESIMHRCRFILRTLASTDDGRTLATFLQGTLFSPVDYLESIDKAMLARPIDFRIIDLRLDAGSYGDSPEAFASDVRQIFKNVILCQASDIKAVQLVESLSQLFEKLYDEQVLHRPEEPTDGTKQTCAEPETLPTQEQPQVQDGQTKDQSNSLNWQLPKAPWEEGVCKVCGVDKDDDSVLLCDTCDAEYHIYCLTPPLTKIPEGNWYCPTCISGKEGEAKSSHDDNMPDLNISEEEQKLQTIFHHLTKTLEENDYWDLTVSDRTLLLKILCEKALETQKIREHLEKCHESSSELQQKLRLLTTERRNYLESSQQDGGRPGGTLADPDRGEKIKQIIANDAGYFNATLQNAWTNLTGEKGARSGLINDSHRTIDLNIPLVQRLDDEGESSIVVTNVIGQSSNVRASLDSEIEVLEYKVLCESIRRELLGRDDLGRMYWTLCLQDKRPWLVVQLEEFIPSLSAHEEYPSHDTLRVSCVDLVKAGNTFGNLHLKGSFLCGWKDGCLMFSSNEGAQEKCLDNWTVYATDEDIDKLLAWLKSSSQQEGPLRSALLHCKSLLGRNSTLKQGVGSGITFLDGIPYKRTMLFPLTKGAKIIKASRDSEALGQNAKLTKKGGVLKPKSDPVPHCECLEPLWRSGYHCLTCHETYGTIHETDNHNQGQCAASRGYMIKGNRDQYSAGGMGKTPGKLSKKAAKSLEVCFVSITFSDSLSARERILRIGFTDQEPSFSPPLPFSPFFDPSLMTVVASEPKIGYLEMQTSLPATQDVLVNNVAPADALEDIAGVCDDAINNNKAEENSSLLVTAKCTNLSPSMNPLDPAKSPILKNIKMILLEIEAVLSNDMLEPSRSAPSRRRRWRSFLKSSRSIFEVIQAIIIFEQMVKADFLRSPWGLWSSLSLAGKTSTIAALALRLYALDSAIMYKTQKKVAEVPSPNINLKPRKKVGRPPKVPK